MIYYPSMKHWDLLWSRTEIEAGMRIPYEVGILIDFKKYRIITKKETYYFDCVSEEEYLELENK